MRPTPAERAAIGGARASTEALFNTLTSSYTRVIIGGTP